jgi:hypothetical protein
VENCLLKRISRLSGLVNEVNIDVIDDDDGVIQQPDRTNIEFERQSVDKFMRVWMLRLLHHDLRALPCNNLWGSWRKTTHQSCTSVCKSIF